MSEPQTDEQGGQTFEIGQRVRYRRTGIIVTIVTDGASGDFTVINQWGGAFKATAAEFEPAPDYKAARGAFNWQPGDEPAEQTVRRIRDGGDAQNDDALLMRIDALEAENDALREALEPFAAIGRILSKPTIHPRYTEGDPPIYGLNDVEILRSDFTRAAEVCAHTGE